MRSKYLHGITRYGAEINSREMINMQSAHLLYVCSSKAKRFRLREDVTIHIGPSQEVVSR